MARCANCEHPLGSHTLDGCDSCNCLFGFNTKGYPVGYEDAVANPDRVTAADGQAGGSHYLEMPIQPWEIIDAFGLGYYEGSILSYLLRAGRKGSKLEDLRKAGHFLEKLIELEEKEES